jgi:hypothetical protein
MITMKIIAFWDVLTRSSVNVLLGNFFLLVSYLAHSLFLKMESVFPWKVGGLLLNYTVLRPRKLCSSYRDTGFSDLSIVRILNKSEKNVSETGSVSVLRWRKTPTVLDPLERASLNHWTASISVCYTPSSEPYSIYLYSSCFDNMCMISDFTYRVAVIGRSRHASTSIHHNTWKISCWSMGGITLPWRMLWCSRWGWPHQVNLWFLDKFLLW